MSDIRFNRWLHQSGTGGVYQDSSGRVGIGTSVPTTALDVQSGSIKIGSNTLSSSGVSTFTTVNATTVNATTVNATTVNATSLVGVTTAGITTAYINTLSGISTIDASAAVSINQNLVFASGKGIDFSATTDATGSSSELLSDYEEGVHTVTLKRSSGGTTLTQGTHYNILSSQTTSNSNQYRYIKIGNVVHLSFSIRFLASEAGQNGRYNISLPYSIAGNGYSFAGSIGLYNFNQTLNQGIFLSASATSLDFFDLAAGNGTHTNLYPNSGAEIYFNGYYFTI